MNFTESQLRQIIREEIGEQDEHVYEMLADEISMLADDITSNMDMLHVALERMSNTMGEDLTDADADALSVSGVQHMRNIVSAIRWLQRFGWAT